MLLASFLAAVTLTIDPRQVVARFDPRTAFGATIDAHEEGENAQIFTPATIAAMRSAGFHPLSYRLATELGGEAWHWNPRGTWSDERRQQGYWTSSDELKAPIDASYGYRLPRRGNTLDQARNDSYSRIDDGDGSTFWKSNPYLDDRPQWLFVDLGEERPVSAIRIAWGQPFAVEYRVQRWTGSDPINMPASGDWAGFPHGVVRNGVGGDSTWTLADAPVAARYVRVWMAQPGTRSSGEGDWRDDAGFAVREVSILDAAGQDLVRHGTTNATQSIIWTSSTDPWHRAADLDRNVEQLGIDRLFATGLTNALPALLPVALLYGTPDDASALLRYLRDRQYPVRRIELGEEPDGQFFSPEDYGTLYLKWADALHAIDPELQLGGPAFQSTNDFIAFWPGEGGKTAWIGRFLDLLRSRDRLADFAFFSFEWYPFDDLCVPSEPQLVEAPRMLARVLQRWRDEGVPATIPWLATEYGYSSYAGRPEVDLTGALVNAEFVAQFLSLGGSGAYFYGLEPDVLLRELHCPTYGNLMLFLSDEEHRIRYPLATLHAARLLTQVWTEPACEHALLAVHGTTSLLSAFAVRRPDGRVALLLVNKDAKAATVRLLIGTRAVQTAVVHQLSPREYVWHPRGEQGFPSPDRPPRTFRAKRDIPLPGMSLSVVIVETSRTIEAP